MASLLTLPAEVQKSIITSLDYASLCQLRSTSRYFYNFLTESEIHCVFLNTEIEQVDFSVARKDGGKCRSCAKYCDGTATQHELGQQAIEQVQKDIAVTEEPVVAARNIVTIAQAAVRKAKAAVKMAKGPKQQAKKQVLVDQAQQDLKYARDNVKIAQENAAHARAAIHAASSQNLDLATRCFNCKRITNSHLKAGVLDLSTLTMIGPYCGYMDDACTRTKHYSRRLSYAENRANAQIDGKICKTCWKGTNRGASGKQRRHTFTEEYGYWMRQTWLAEAEAIKIQAVYIASRTFEEIEKDMEEAEAAKNLDEVLSIREEVASVES